MLLVHCKWLFYQTTTLTCAFLVGLVFTLAACFLIRKFRSLPSPVGQHHSTWKCLLHTSGSFAFITWLNTDGLYRITQLHHWKVVPREAYQYAAKHSYCCSNLQHSFEDGSFQLGHFRNPFRPQREFFKSCAKDHLARAKWGYSSCPDLEIRNIQWHDVKVLYSGIGSLILTHSIAV